VNDLARVTIEPHDDVVHARVSGEVDLSNAEQVFEQVLDGWVGRGSKGLVVDLSETTYIDSAGIRALFELAERLRALGCSVRTVVPDASPVRRVMKLAEAERVLDLDASLEGALAALG